MKRYISNINNITKSLAVISTVAVVALSLSSYTTSAEEIKVKLNGSLISFDAKPCILEDRTMVPMRAILEALGLEVSWDSETQIINAVSSDGTLTLQVGNNEIIKNGETYTFDSAPVIIDDRTLVPVRAVSELLGLEVDWKSKTNTVEITTEEYNDVWKSNLGTIDLDDMEVSGEGVSISSNTISINKGGDFTVNGTLSEGMIYINSSEKVKLRLNGVNITNSTGPAIFFDDVKKGFITIESGTTNVLTDGTEYTQDAKSTLFSNDNLEIKGTGNLIINANYKHGICSDDDISIQNGNITINAVGDGIKANGDVEITDGTIEITTKQDGIQADANVKISSGDIKIMTTGDVSSSSNNFRNVQQTEDTTISSKGIKTEIDLTISGGSFDIKSTGHSVHSNGSVNIIDGDFVINSSAGKGISGDGNVTIDDGNILIENATEGIESKAVLTINDGIVHIICTDDGLNAGGGNSSMGGGMMQGGGRPQGNRGETTDINAGVASENNTVNNSTGGRGKGGQGITPPDSGMTSGGTRGNRGELTGINAGTADGNNAPNNSTGSRGGMQGGNIQGMTPPDENMPKDNTSKAEQSGNGQSSVENILTESTSHDIILNGGYIYINSKCDGIDSNGNVVVNGGTLIIDGPTSGGDSAIDYDGNMSVSGGLIIAAGSAGMAQASGNTSEQSSVMINFLNTLDAKTPVCIQDEDGNNILTYVPAKNYQNLVFSSDSIEEGKTYSVYYGGTVSGSEENGVYKNNTTDGTLYQSFTVSSTGTTKVGSSVSGGGGRGRM